MDKTGTKRGIAAGLAGLLERDSEFATIEATLEETASRAGALVAVQGPAGVGKTALLDAAHAAALNRGMTTLSATGSELEQEFAFGVAIQLFGRALTALPAERRKEMTRGAAGLAIPLLEGSEDGQDGRDIQSLLHGLHWLASNLAGEAPLVLIIDDAHWADGPSLRFLAYLLQRLEDLPIAVLVALRPSEGAARLESMTLLRPHRATTVLDLQPLSSRGVDRLIRTELGDEVDDALCTACAEASGGNPFLLRELIAELDRERDGNELPAPEQIAGLAPAGVLWAVLARLASLPEEATELARALAILGDGMPLRSVAQLAGVEPGEAEALIDALVDADVFEGGERLNLSFVHPLVHSAIYSDLPMAWRGNAHLRAARQLDSDGEPLERVAAQLLKARSGSDPWVVETLERAARQASMRGAHTTVAAYLRRALDEPPSEEARAELLVTLGQVQAANGDPIAPETLSAAIEGMSDPDRRARVFDAVGRALFAQGQVREASAAFKRGLEELDDDDGPTARELKARYANTAMMDTDARQDAQEHVDRLLSSPAEMMVPGERALAAFLAMGSALSGGPGETTRALASRALDGGPPLDPTSPDEGMAFTAVAVALLYMDDLDTSEALLDDGLEIARERGLVIAFATASYLRAWPQYFRGRLNDAVADAEQALDAGRYGWKMFAGAASAVLAHAHVDRGDLAAAQRAVDAAPQESLAPESGEWTILLEARARIRRGRHDLNGALEDLLECGELLSRGGFATRPTLWRAQAAVICAQLGDRERARELIEAELELAGRVDARRTTGMVLRAAGLVAEDPEERLDFLSRSVETLRESPSRLELARALVDQGASMRKAGQRAAARVPLREGRDLAHRFGATPLFEFASEELKATGARPRRIPLTGVDSLTASERRVAQLAASGLGNREIAESLFVTRKAVEFHLGNTYSKLGINSRKALPEALSASTEG